MSQSEQTDSTDQEIVSVTQHGQATIPKRFREKLGITTPGRVVFRETEDGTIIVDRVRSPSEMRGFAAQHAASTDKPASQLLREKRRADKEQRDTSDSPDR